MGREERWDAPNRTVFPTECGQNTALRFESLENYFFFLVDFFFFFLAATDFHLRSRLRLNTVAKNLFPKSKSRSCLVFVPEFLTKNKSSD